MFYARLILVILICLFPFVLLMDGAIIRGVVAGVAATGIAVVACTMRPGETKFLTSMIRPGAVLAAVPALWIVIQILPLKAIANPIWTSAGAALGHPLSGLISIDLGASVMALGLYLSTGAAALLSAAVAVDRQRAESVLFALMGATAVTALILLFYDLAGLTVLNGVGTSSGRAQATDCAAIGTIVAVTAVIRTLERYETRRNPKRLDGALVWSFVASCAALVTCAMALIASSTGTAMVAAGYGVAALIGIAVIRRLSIGPWAVVAIAASMIGLAVLLIANEPGLRTKGVALAFAAPGQSALISASQRILHDIPWTGTGAGTFAKIMPIYRDIDDPSTSTAPTAVAALAIELGPPMLWLIIAAAFGALVVLIRAALQRGRDSFYPAAGAGCLVALFFLSFMNAGILSTATAMIGAVVLGLALAQSKSRTIQ